jgi:hypothetical protein
VKLWEKIKMTKFSPKGFFLAHGNPKIVIRDLDFGGVGIFKIFFLIFFLTSCFSGGQAGSRLIALADFPLEFHSGFAKCG